MVTDLFTGGQVPQPRRPVIARRDRHRTALQHRRRNRVHRAPVELEHLPDLLVGTQVPDTRRTVPAGGDGDRTAVQDSRRDTHYGVFVAGEGLTDRQARGQVQHPHRRVLGPDNGDLTAIQDSARHRIDPATARDRIDLAVPVRPPPHTRTLTRLPGRRGPGTRREHCSFPGVGRRGRKTITLLNVGHTRHPKTGHRQP